MECSTVGIYQTTLAETFARSKIYEQKFLP